MKRDKIIYWVITSLFVLALGFSAINYFTNPAMKEAFIHLGFPDYFRVELGIAKLLGCLALIIPQVPFRVKEWAYAGFAIDLISAAIAHASSGDPAGAVVFPAVLLVIMVVSYVYFHKLNVKQSLFA